MNTLCQEMACLIFEKNLSCMDIYNFSRTCKASYRHSSAELNLLKRLYSLARTQFYHLEKKYTDRKFQRREVEKECNYVGHYNKPMNNFFLHPLGERNRVFYEEFFSIQLQLGEIEATYKSHYNFQGREDYTRIQRHTIDVYYTRSIVAINLSFQNITTVSSAGIAVLKKAAKDSCIVKKSHLKEKNDSCNFFWWLDRVFTFINELP